MEFLDIFTVFNDLANWVVWALSALSLLLLGLLKFLANPIRLASLAGSFGANTIRFLSERKLVRQLTDQRKLSPDPTLKSAKHHDDSASNRGFKTGFYREQRLLKKADREGPYAVSVFIEDLFNENFQVWQQRFRDDLAKFDHLEKVVRDIVYLYENDSAVAEAVHIAAINQLKETMEEAQINWEDTADKLGKLGSAESDEEYGPPAQKGMWGKVKHSWNIQGKNAKRWWQYIKELRRFRKEVKQLKKQIKELEKKRNASIRPIERKTDKLLKVAAQRLNTFESDRLIHRAHTFLADWNSNMLTVEVGRTLERLTSESELAQEVRKIAKLENFPTTMEGALLYMEEYLKGRVGFNPNVHPEDLFETWIRVFYLDMAEEELPENVGHLWLKTLCPPGSKGVAQKEFGHFPHPMAWLPEKQPRVHKPYRPHHLR